jgi:hypothetical protein
MIRLGNIFHRPPRPVTFSYNTTLPVGQTITPTLTVHAADNAKSVSVMLDLTHWVTGTQLSAVVEILLNSAWQPVVSWTLDQRGFALDGVTPAPSTGVVRTFYDVLPDTEVRAVITITGNPLQTTITATAT